MLYVLPEVIKKIKILQNLAVFVITTHC